VDNARLIISIASPVIGLLGLAAIIATIHYGWAGIRYLNRRDEEELDDRFEVHNATSSDQTTEDRIKAMPQKD